MKQPRLLRSTLAVLAVLLTVAGGQAQQLSGRWTVERAQAWEREAGWLVVGAMNWGFVSGKSQTIYPWDSWENEYSTEPPVWFHDIFRTDGTPYRQGEVELIRSLTGSR